MGEHDYGRWDEKPVSTCRRCGEQNFALRSWMGHVTRRAKVLGVSWLEAERQLRVRRAA